MARSHRNTGFGSTFDLNWLLIEGSSTLLFCLVLSHKGRTGFLLVIGGGLHPGVVLNLFYGVALGSIEGEQSEDEVFEIS